MRSAIKYTAIVTAAFFFGALVMMSGSSNATTTAGKTRTVTVNHTQTKTISKAPAECVTAIHLTAKAGGVAAQAMADENTAIRNAVLAGDINLAVPGINAATAKINKATSIVHQAAAPAAICEAAAQ